MPHRSKRIVFDGYEIEDVDRALLGSGTYGSVYLGRDTATGDNVAIKRNHDNAHEEGVPSTVMREMSLLRLLKHSPHVVKLKDVIYRQEANRMQAPIIYMIFEHLDCDLHTYLERYRPLKPPVVQRLMYHILLGLHHIQSVGMMHRDLKPQNILVDNKKSDGPTAKLADFGFGRTITLPIRQLTEEIITLWYRPPEVLMGYEGHSPAVDIWSAACILSEMHENGILFKGENGYHQLVTIFRQLGTPTIEDWAKLSRCEYWHEYPRFKKTNLKDSMPGTPPDAVDLLEKMLVHDPAKRPSPAECLQHPYFASIYKAKDLTMPIMHKRDVKKPEILMGRSHTEPVLRSNQSAAFNGVFGSTPGGTA